MASPLPKTNAPAFAKKRPSCVSSDQSHPAAAAHVDVHDPLSPHRAGAALLSNQRFGDARTSHTNTPAPRNSQALSDCVHTVTPAVTRKIAHSSLSLPI